MKTMLIGTLVSYLVASLAVDAANVTWNLATGGAWDTTTANWTGGRTTYVDGSTDNVTFNNTGGGTITIQGGGVTPISTTVSAGSGTYSFSGGNVLGGTLFKSGAGTLNLSNTNAFTSITVTGGTMNVKASGAIGSSAVNLFGGATLNLLNDTSVNYGNDLLVSGSGTATLGSGRFTGGQAITNTLGNLTLGPLTFAVNFATGVNQSPGAPRLTVGTVSLGGNMTFSINNEGSGNLAYVFAGAISETTASSLTKTSAGRLVLTAACTYSGGTVINGGSIDAAADNAMGNGSIFIGNGGTLRVSSTNALLRNTDGSPLPIALAGGGALYLKTGSAVVYNNSLTVTGSGTATIQGGYLNGTNDVFGALTIGGQTLSSSAWNIDNIGPNSNPFLTFGTVTLTGNATLDVQNTANAKSATWTCGAVGEDAAGRTLTKTGAGTLRLAAGGTYSGGTTFNGGTVAIADENALGAAGGPLAFGSGRLNMTNSFTFNNRAVTINTTGGTLGVDPAGSTVTLTNLLSGTGKLGKGGAGTLRLLGPSTFTGDIAMAESSASSGTLVFNSAGVLGAGTLWGNYSSSLTLSNASGGLVTLPHNFASVNNNYSVYFAGNDIALTGTVTAAGNGNATFYAGTGQSVTFNGPITGTPSLNAAAGYYGAFILAPAAGTSGRISVISANCTIGIATNDAFGVTTGAQYTDCGNTPITFFAVGGNWTINSAIRWGGYNGVQIFSGSNNLTFTANQNAGWYNSNNQVAWKVTAPLVTMAGLINESACANFYKAGSGVLAFTATNTYTSKTYLDEGTLRATQGVGLPTNSNLAIASGGVLETSGTFNRTLGTTAGLLQWVTGWIGDPATGGYGTGSGGFAAYGGPLTVDLNTLGLRDTFVWASTASFVPAAGILVLNSATATDPVTFYDNIDLNAAVRTIQVNDNPSTSNDYALIAGNLTGSGVSGLTKTGAGTLALSGANTYTGVTTVSVGMLLVNGSLAGSSNSVIVANGATLGGTGTIQRAVSVQTGGTLRGGIPGTGGILTISSNVTVAAGAVLACDVVNGALVSSVNVAGSLTLATSGSVTINRTGEQLSSAMVLITASGGISCSSITNWTVPDKYRLSLTPTQLLLRPRQGVLFMVD